MKKIINKKLFIPLFILLLAIITIVGISYGERLYNDEEVIPNSKLTYYLDVYYDGVDKDGVKSNDTTISNISSGYMIVEDRIPEGLTFTGFVATNDGTIGAVKRSDGTVCPGSVVDDTNETKVNDGSWNDEETEYYYHGLHYNASTKTVSFKVKNLKAGCKLTVGIKTKIAVNADNPDTADIEKRLDFYNIATVREDALTAISNILHAYMGLNGINSYKVNYSYEGVVPSNTPTIPNVLEYSIGSKVNVAMPINVEGYTFNGWTTTDVEVVDGAFTMPNHEVNFVGSYTELPKYNVTYVINGETPEGYVAPTKRGYYESNNVSVDILKKDDVFNGYSFSGWTTNDTTFDEEDSYFIMPNHDVTLYGSFTKKKYKITFAFYETVLPQNASSLLPQEVEYLPNENVVLPTISDTNGYHFLGWNRDSSFKMPNENIIVYGEWKRQNGSFEPTVSVEIINPKDRYMSGDTVEFKVIVNNNSNYAINDIYVKESLDDIEFVESEDYEISSNHIVKIHNINANSSKIINMKYTVKKNDFGTMVNNIELISAISNNNAIKNNIYKTQIQFDVVSQLIVHHYVEATTTKVYDDQISKVDVGAAYTTNEINTSQLLYEYKNNYIAVNSTNNTSGIVDKNVIEVIYYYGIRRYEISVRVVGGVGTVTGSEIVVGGNNSKEDIIIKPNDGYEISKISINGIKVIITDKDEMILDKFTNVRENIDIEVEFTEKDQIAPITGARIKVYFIIIILEAIALAMICLYRKFVSKKTGGDIQ